MPMQYPCFIHNKLVLFSLIIIVWLIPCDRIWAQSYWDAVFELGYDPFTHQVRNSLAYQRINNLYELHVQVSEYLEIDPELQSIMQNLHSRLTSLDAANLYDTMPSSDQAGLWRGVGIRGSSNTQNYQLIMYNPDTSDWLSSSAGNNSRYNGIGFGRQRVQYPVANKKRMPVAVDSRNRRPS
jgi:hypothetical protein